MDTGCEDPRVTFIPVLDRYLMGYTACGPQGTTSGVCLVALTATSGNRIGLARFPQELGLAGDDKDVVFFPEAGDLTGGCFFRSPFITARCTKCLRRRGKSEIQTTLSLNPAKRQSIRIAYVPLAQVLEDLNNITEVSESVLVMSPGESWGRIKLGAGTRPAARGRRLAVALPWRRHGRA